MVPTAAMTSACHVQFRVGECLGSKTDANYNHAQLGLPDKDSAIKGLVMVVYRAGLFTLQL